MKVFKLVLAGLLALAIASPVLAEDFPLRAKYPTVKPISIDKLAADYNSSIIVDVRAEMEFDVVHISKAKFIPVTKADFLTQLEKLRPKDGAESLVFYCNGHTCAKSYKASEMATENGFKNVYCFDAGIFEWVSKYPERGVLLGKSPVDKSKLISKATLAGKMLAWSAFQQKAGDANAIVIDTRDPFQRAKDSKLDQNKNVDLKGIRAIPMDRLVGLLEKGEFKGNQLLIFDAVGKQVEWLQYYLEEHGYTNYAFLKNGVLAAAEAGAVK